MSSIILKNYDFVGNYEILSHWRVAQFDSLGIRDIVCAFEIWYNMGEMGYRKEENSWI